MVAHNKYYVYDFDNIQQTALHWAAKRNYKDIIELLVQNGANVNYTDIVRIGLFNYDRVGELLCIWQQRNLTLIA